MRLLTRMLLLVALPVAGSAQTPPVYEAADPAAPVVTERNLAASERFWPYRVSLLRPWRSDAEAKALEAGRVGVLLRVDGAGRATIDFGRDGRHSLPVAATDLVSRANRIRTGESDKHAPNLVLAIGPRLQDPSREDVPRVELSSLLDERAFLCVFGDASAESLRRLAASLAPLGGREGLATVLLPRNPGARRDAEVAGDLRRLGWKALLMPSLLAEVYRPSLLGDELELPAVSLQSPEGRILFEGSLDADSSARIEAALEAARATSPAEVVASDGP